MAEELNWEFGFTSIKKVAYKSLKEDYFKNIIYRLSPGKTATRSLFWLLNTGY